MDKIECWVITDKNKKAIACGSPRNRQMRMMNSLGNKPIRILMYGTEGRAKMACSNGQGFYDETDGYLAKTYTGKYPGVKFFTGSYQDICIAVKVSLVFDE